MNLQVRTLLIAIVVPTAAAAVDSAKAKPAPAPHRIASVLEELAPVHRHRLWWPKADPPHCPPTPRHTEA